MGVARGSCYCGGVQFEAELPPRFVAHCHCDNCRRAHGAAFVTWAGFPGAAFRWTAGAEDVGSFQTETRATRSFCRVCGTPLTFSSPRWAGEVHVALAHFQDPVGKEPGAHVYADRAPSWAAIHDALPRLGGPSGTESLADA